MIRLMTPMLLLCAALFAAPALADESADDIVRASYEKSYRGNSIQQMTLTQTIKSGAKDPMGLTTSTRIDGGSVKTHALMLRPEMMSGTQFLTIATEGAATQRWMYLSAGQTTTTIDSSKRTTPFMGTDFTHEDMELGDPAAGTHQLLGTETITVGGQAVECYKIESIPKPELTSMYGKLVTWIEKGSYAPRKVLLFAKDDTTTEFKRLTFDAVAVKNGAVLPTNLLMENLAKETSTRIEVTEYRLDVPADELPDSLFDHTQFGANVPQ